MVTVGKSSACFQNTKMLAVPVRTQGAEAGSSLAPATLATDFNFAGVSDAV